MDPELAAIPQQDIKPSRSLLLPMLIAIVVILTMASGFLAYQNIQLRKQITKELSLPPTPTPFLVDETRSLESTQPKAFSKKHFLSTDKFFDTQEYPSELTNLMDIDLVGFTCGNKYNNQWDGNFIFYDKAGKPEPLTDQAILSLLSIEEKNATQRYERNSLLSAIVCKTDAEKTLISYEITPGGGGAGSSVYYGYISTTNSVSVSAVVPMENGAYFGCNDILAITKTGDLYVNCGAGDGGAGSKSLYRLNIHTGGNATLLQKCTSTSSGQENEEPVIQCGTTQ